MEWDFQLWTSWRPNDCWHTNLNRSLCRVFIEASRKNSSPGLWIFHFLSNLIYSGQIILLMVQSGKPSWDWFKCWRNIIVQDGGIYKYQLVMDRRNLMNCRLTGGTSSISFDGIFWGHFVAASNIEKQPLRKPMLLQSLGCFSQLGW